MSSPCKRWKAYKQKNFSLFNHYKEKVKIEIAKAKKLWVSKILEKTKNPWKVIKSRSNNTIQLKKNHRHLPHTFGCCKFYQFNFSFNFYRTL